MDRQDNHILDVLYMHMIRHFAGDPKRIQHFIKVHSLARLIGRREGLDGEALLILEAAAYIHDIGIREAERLYGSSSGKLQEQLGPEIAAGLLKECGFSAAQIDRITYLVGHHHTYTEIDGVDYQILVEADFLVNLYEDESSPDTVRTVYQQIFKTDTGREICRTMFDIA